MGKRRPPSKPSPQRKTPAADGDGQQGLVLAHYGQASLVENEQGEVLRCATRRSLPRTVCGDRVLYRASSPREGVITEILERRTTLVRPDRNGRIRAVAANIDQIVVVIASRPSFEYGMLDRYLAAAEIIGAPPAIVVNKLDLLDDESHDRLVNRLNGYAALGYPLIFTSTRTTDGLRDLHRQLRDHTSILVGQSGVGKSSLVQALLPDQDVRIGPLSKVTGLGRHTTTVAMLYHLPDGGHLIDSPGVRDFSLWPVSVAELARGFVEFRPYIGQCRFHDCRHNGEPGCAVAEAARRGDIDTRRLENYREILAQQMQ